MLASRVAFLTQDVFLSLRYLEEAQPLLDKAGAAREEQAALAAELLERSFLKLKQRIGDTERLGPATREAEALRQRLGENRRRFGDERLKNRNAEIDVELAKGLLNAGQVVEAEALLVRAVQSEDAGAEAAIELAKLAMKRGDARRAGRAAGTGAGAPGRERRTGDHPPGGDPVEAGLRPGQRPRGRRTPGRGPQGLAGGAARVGAADGRAPAPQERRPREPRPRWRSGG